MYWPIAPAKEGCLFNGAPVSGGKLLNPSIFVPLGKPQVLPELPPRATGSTLIDRFPAFGFVATAIDDTMVVRQRETASGLSLFRGRPSNRRTEHF
jgi:hypothetical protein